MHPGHLGEKMVCWLGRDLALIDERRGCVTLDVVLLCMYGVSLMAA